MFSRNMRGIIPIKVNPSSQKVSTKASMLDWRSRFPYSKACAWVTACVGLDPCFRRNWLAPSTAAR